jgi:hypothetical protein
MRRPGAALNCLENVSPTALTAANELTAALSANQGCKLHREAASAVSRPASHSLEILGSRFAGLAVDHDLERDALTFFEFAQAGTLDGADVDEHVLAATFGLDESITLLRVEPLNGSVAHGALLFRIKI